MIGRAKVRSVAALMVPLLLSALAACGAESSADAAGYRPEMTCADWEATAEDERIQIARFLFALFDANEEALARGDYDFTDDDVDTTSTGSDERADELSAELSAKCRQGSPTASVLLTALRTDVVVAEYRSLTSPHAYSRVAEESIPTTSCRRWPRLTLEARMDLVAKMLRAALELDGDQSDPPKEHVVEAEREISRQCGLDEAPAELPVSGFFGPIYLELVGRG